MKKFVLISIMIALNGLTSPGLRAQITLAPSLISSSGNYIENENLSIAWTFGELAITSLQGENMILTQGFQQPINYRVGIQENEIKWNISVYPNPVHDELYIQFDLRESEDFLLEIQDVTGRLLLQESHDNVFPGDLLILNISDFAIGAYFIKIFTTDLQQVKVAGIWKL